MSDMGKFAFQELSLHELENELDLKMSDQDDQDVDMGKFAFQELSPHEDELKSEADRLNKAANESGDTQQNYVLKDYVGRIEYKKVSARINALLDFFFHRHQPVKLCMRTDQNCVFSQNLKRFVRCVDMSSKKKGMRQITEKRHELVRSLLEYLDLNLSMLMDGKSFMPLPIRTLYYILYNKLGGDDVSITPVVVTMLVDDLCCVLACDRESLGVMAYDTNASYVGNIIVTRQDIDSTEPVEENGTKLCQSHTVHLNNIHTISSTIIPPCFILVVEKLTVFATLCSSRFHHKLPCVIIMGSGQPSLDCRLFLNKVHKSLGKEVPVFALVDCNLFGFEIFRTFKYGSQNMAHMSSNLVVPEIKLLGTFYSDFERHHIEEAAMLSFDKLDSKKAIEMLKEDWIQDEPLVQESLQKSNKSKKKGDIELLYCRIGYEVWETELLDSIKSFL